MNNLARENPSGQKRFHASAVWLLTLWCSFWLIVFAAKYVGLTWQLCSDLNGLQWPLTVSPCFWMWIFGFAFAVWALERSIRLTRRGFEKSFNLTKAAMLIAAMPLALWAGFTHLFPYVYPASAGIVRLVPFIGGKGF